MSSAGGKYNLYSQGSTGWSILRNEEFQEHDIWGALHQKNETDYKTEYSVFTSSRTQPTTTARTIPKFNSRSHLGESKKLQQSSAPLNVPDWSKIYGKEASSNTVSWNFERDNQGGIMNNNWEIDEEEDDDSESMIPPHEWIARKVSRSGITSFSVYEGVGRTLKGRDLSNVRNAVLSKTGFLE